MTNLTPAPAVETAAQMRTRHAAERAAEDARRDEMRAAQAQRWDVLQLWHDARWAAVCAR